MSEKAGDPTEEPTPKKLREARKRGEVAQSRELAGMAALVGALGVCAIGVGAGISELANLMRSGIVVAVAGNPADAAPLLESGLAVALRVLGPVLGAAVALGGLVAFLQVGPLLSWGPVQPKLERLNPAAGLKR